MYEGKKCSQHTHTFMKQLVHLVLLKGKNEKKNLICKNICNIKMWPNCMIHQINKNLTFILT